MVCLGADLLVTGGKDNFAIVVDAKEGNIKEYITEFDYPMRMMVRGAGVSIPEFETNRVAVKTGNDIMYYPLLERPDGVMGADITRSKVVVADYNGHRIIYFGGGKNKTFGSQGSAHGQFSYPTDVQHYDGKIYVADNQNRRVEVFDAEGQHVQTIGEGVTIGQASGIFVSKEGVVLCDKGEGKIVIFDLEGNVLQEISEGFERPSDAYIFVNTLYVADEEGGFIGVLQRNQ